MFLRPEDARGNAQTEWLTRRLLNPAEYADNRRAAAQALARTPDPRGLLALTAALDDPDAKVREHARGGLTAAGWTGAQHLHPLVTASSPDAELAARTLGIIGDPSSVEVLLAVLDDARPTVAAEAAIALGCLGEPCAVEPLYALLQQSPELAGESVTLRRWRDASRALGIVGDPRAVDTLCRSLRAPDVIAEAAAQALGALGNPWAAEPLIAALARIDPYYHAQRSTLRLTLYQALGQIADPRVVRPLCQALSDSVPSMRQTAAASLHALSDDLIREGLASHGGWASLPAAMAGREDPVTWQALRAAGLSSRPDLLPTLRKLRFPWSQELTVAVERAIASIKADTLPTHPIPASAPVPSLENLPTPAEALSLKPDLHPIPHQSPCENPPPYGPT